MRGLTLCLALMMGGSLMAQNPSIEILSPREGGLYWGGFVVRLQNFDYAPELATNPITEFAIGQDAAGDPLRFAEGHVHGWVFQVDRWGNRIDPPNDRPTPASYKRFYGAGGAEFFPSWGIYWREDELEDLPRGWYKAFFVLQQNDHTAAKQITAPAFPGISSVMFYKR